MKEETLTYNADGIVMKSRLFFEPASGRRPGVLVFPEAFGLGDQAIERAQRLASLGYITLASDLHGNGRFIDDLPRAMALVQPLFDDPIRTRARATAAHLVLAARPEVECDRIAAISFCFPMALELARSGATIQAAAGFHTSLSSKVPVAGPNMINARILVCIGADDPFIPPAERAQFEAEMRGADADWQMELYGRTVHGFTNPDAGKRNMPNGLRYSPEADSRSWASLLGLLAATIGP